MFQAGLRRCMFFPYSRWLQTYFSAVDPNSANGIYTQYHTFFPGTQTTSAGAIAPAEFLPESTSLRSGLTNNVLDIAGVMTLSSDLEANHVMRCLDLNISENCEFSRCVVLHCLPS